jgi:biopolymer transport protein ExbB
LDTSYLGFLKSSWSIWIIGACSVLALAVAIERAIALWGFSARARTVADAVLRALLRGDLEEARAECERSPSPAADVFLAGLAAAGRRTPRGGGPDLERIDAAVERERQQVNLRLRRNVWILGTIGAIAPFIGLFGTVVGIMQAFRHMAATGQGGFTVVASGISRGARRDGGRHRGRDRGGRHLQLPERARGSSRCSSSSWSRSSSRRSTRCSPPRRARGGARPAREA